MSMVTKKERISNIVTLVSILALFFVGIWIFTGKDGVSAQTIAFPLDGGTGIGSATAGDVGNCLKVLTNSPFTYELGACGGGAGGSGLFSTSTDNLVIYNNTGETVVIEGTATSSDWTSGTALEVYGSTLIQSDLTVSGLTATSGTFTFDNTLITEHPTLEFFDIQSTLVANEYTLMRVKAPQTNPSEATIALLIDEDGDNSGVNESFFDWYNENYGDSYQAGLRLVDNGTARPKPIVFGHFNDDGLSKDDGNKLVLFPSGTVYFGQGTSTASLTSQVHISSSTAANLLEIDGSSGNELVLSLAGQLTLSALDCTGNANGGALTANASGVIACSDDDGGGGTFGSLTDVATSSDATGDIWYLNSSGQIVNLGVGSANQVLTVSGGLPSWQDAAAGGGTGAFATSTVGGEEIASYANDVTIGGVETATGTAAFWFDESATTSYIGTGGTGSSTITLNNSWSLGGGDDYSAFILSTGADLTNEVWEVNTNGTTTALNGFDITTGCYSIAGTCLIHSNLGTVDISDDTNLVAGRSLTLSGDQLNTDPELYTETFTMGFATTSMATTSFSGAQHDLPNNASISVVRCNSIGSGTTTIGIDERTAPNTAGSEILYSSGMECGPDFINSTSTFSDSSVAGDAIWNLSVIDAEPTGDAANIVRVTVEYTIDD